MSNVEPEKLKNNIIEVLKRHPEGLTVVELSRKVKLHRQTVSKYILELKGSGQITKRIAGSASLCYLKKYYTAKKSMRRRK